MMEHSQGPLVYQIWMMVFNDGKVYQEINEIVQEAVHEV